MDILFIGGTGRLSKDVAARALEKGNNVYLLTRGSKERKMFVDNGYQMIYGNIRDVEATKKLLNSYHFDVVIDFLTFDVRQLKNMLSIIEGKFQQYIFISTATLYKKTSEDEIISEKTTSVGNECWDYALKKYQCEEYVKNYFENKSNEKYTIVRPYVTYGNTRIPYPIVPQDATKEWSFIDRILHNQPIPVFDEGKTVTTLMHTSDFAKGVVGLFANKNAYGEAFHVTTSKTTTWGTVLELLEDALETKINRLSLTQENIINVCPEYKGILVGDKGTTMRFDNQKITDTVPEFICDVTLKEGIKEMIAFYQNNKELQKIDYKWQGEMDRLCAKYGAVSNRVYNFSTRNDKKVYICGRYFLPRMLEKIKNKTKKILSKIKHKLVK